MTAQPEQSWLTFSTKAGRSFDSYRNVCDSGMRNAIFAFARSPDASDAVEPQALTTPSARHATTSATVFPAPSMAFHFPPVSGLHRASLVSRVSTEAGQSRPVGSLATPQVRRPVASEPRPERSEVHRMLLRGETYHLLDRVASSA